MADGSIISPDDLRNILRCDFQTGELFWIERPRLMFGSNNAWATWNARYAGKPALYCINKRGYRQGRIHGRIYAAHRVVWALWAGEWPDVVDHINQDRADNRVSNLAASDSVANSRNRTLQKNNTSGVTGVRWRERPQRWAASIMVGRKEVWLGQYTSKEDAIAAREKALAEYGFSERHGR